MLRPILEIYTVWHPADLGGSAVAAEFFSHFHGTLYSGLLGGAVETFSRSTGWRSEDGAPRPIPFDSTSSLPAVPAAELVVVVPVLGNALARNVQERTGGWFDYIEDIAKQAERNPTRIFVAPVVLDRTAMSGTVLYTLLGEYQQLGTSTGASEEPVSEARSRDLCQAITQLGSEEQGQRITVFVSHTKRHTKSDDGTVSNLIEGVRHIIAGTRLKAFFDAQDLEVGTKWAAALRERAATSALLAIRTELYASRQWCQEEIRIAKISGMPVVILEALKKTEERGSFLMDHVPRVAARQLEGSWPNEQIRLALNILVDESLKRMLWKRQVAASLGTVGLEVSWWAPHAPEAVTLVEWLRSVGPRVTADHAIRILHPDPPLGRDELLVLEQIIALTKLDAKLEILTPRMLAVRGV